MFINKYISFRASKHGFLLFVSIFIIAVSLFAGLHCGPIVTEKAHLYYAEHKAEEIDKYFRLEKQTLLKSAREMRDDKSLAEYIKNDDADSIFRYISNTKKQKGLGGIAVTDNNGKILYRASFKNTRGDYVFQTVPWGVALSKNNEISGFTSAYVAPMFLIAGAKIYDENNELLGTVSTANILNNDYAKKYKNYNNLNIAFYSKESGSTGDSFDNAKTSKELLHLLSPESDWVMNNKTSGYVKITGVDYLALNVPFTDFDVNSGGYLIFAPVHKTISGILWATLTTLIIIFILFKIHKRGLSPFKITNARFFLTFLIIVAVLNFFIVYRNTERSLVNKYRAENKNHNTIYNSTIKLSPSFGIFENRSEQRIDIMVSVGGERINLVSTNIAFDPEIVQVTEINTDNTFCSNGIVIEKQIDNLNGEINIACVITQTKSIDPTIKVASFYIQPKKTGVAKIIFKKETHVFANDGLATDVLRQTTGGSYAIVSSVDKYAEKSPLIAFSPTHPNSTKWHNKTLTKFVWRGKDDSSFLYSVNSIQNTTPNFTELNKKEIELQMNEGTNYFTLQEFLKDTNVSRVVKYPVNIDLTPPQIPEVKLSEDVVKPNDVVRITFSSKDNLSGLQKNFYISYGDGIYLPVSSPMIITFQEEGEKHLKFKVFDNAGNYSEKEVQITVKN